MSYAGTTTRSSRRHGAASTTGVSGNQRPNGSGSSSFEYEHEGVDWGQVAAFAAGILLGAGIGVASALLTAPQSGWETRDMISRRASRARVRAADAWDDWGYDVRRKAKRTSRRAREAMRLG